MRIFFGVVYWVVVGGLTVVGVYTSVMYGLPPYLLLAALAMAAFEAWRPGFRYSWAATFGLLTLPALALSSSLLDQVFRADWSCSNVSFQPGETVGYGDSLGGEVLCATIPGQLIVASAVLWVITLIVVATLLYLLQRIRAEEPRVHSDATGGSETSVDPVGIFVRAAAILVGVANALVLVDPRTVSASSEGQPLVGFLGTLPHAAAAGLLASEIVLRFGRPALQGRFFARYGITVLGACLGGAIFGASYLILGAFGSLFSGQPGVQGSELLLPVLTYVVLAALIGGVVGAAEGLILAFPLAAILGAFHRSQGQYRGTSLSGVVLLCLVVVAAIASYTTAPPPEAETADLSNNPPLSCPEYMEAEIGSFEGPGNQTTPTFETTGDGWGYEYSSAGPGSLGIGVLDGDGNEVQNPEDSRPPGEESLPGNSVGGTEFPFSGAFRLEIYADDGVDYEVLVCDQPSGRNKGDLSPLASPDRDKKRFS